MENDILNSPFSILHFYMMRPQVCERFIRYQLRQLIDKEVPAVRLYDAITPCHKGCRIRH
jgi:hypothetical protein